MIKLISFKVNSFETACFVQNNYYLKNQMAYNDATAIVYTLSDTLQSGAM